MVYYTREYFRKKQGHNVSLTPYIAEHFGDYQFKTKCNISTTDQVSEFIK
jgi:hypothetical protein